MGSYGSSWQHRGYCGHGNVGALLDVNVGKGAIVAGSAEGVFDDIRFALQARPDAIIYAVNEVGIYLPRVDHFLSLHTHNLAVWKQARWLHPKIGKTLYHAIDNLQSVDYVWDRLTPLMVLSGYFAMQVAWIMGCSPIILCGIPGERKRRFFDLDARADFAYGSEGENGIREQLENEMKRIPAFKDAVRSMSGWTEKYFGGLNGR